MSSNNLIFGITIFCFVIIQCSQKKEGQEESLDFKGAYVFSLSPMQDTIFIENDSVYRHMYWASRDDKYEAEGNWIYDSEEDEILFKKFVFFNDEGPASPAGNWFSKVRVSSEGQIDLMYSKENNTFYRKMW
jgi:hypothetical protein